MKCQQNLESQDFNLSAINQYLTTPEYLACRLYAKTIKERIDTHFRLHATISVPSIKEIIWQEVKKSFIHSGTSLTLFASFIGTNMLFS